MRFRRHRFGDEVWYSLLCDNALYEELRIAAQTPGMIEDRMEQLGFQVRGHAFNFGTIYYNKEKS